MAGTIALLVLPRPCSAAEREEFETLARETCDRFAEHMARRYFDPMAVRGDLRGRDVLLQAKVSGYALGRQLQHASKGSLQHKLWLAVERDMYERFETVVLVTSEEGEIGEAERKTLRQMKLFAQAAIQGLVDPQMAALTGVKGEEEPSVFPTAEAPAKAEATVATMVGSWRLVRGHDAKVIDNEFLHHAEVELSDEVTDTGGVGYKIANPVPVRALWNLKEGVLAFYNTSGDASFRFDRYEDRARTRVWQGYQMHRGEIAEEAGKKVAVTLYRNK